MTGPATPAQSGLGGGAGALVLGRYVVAALGWAGTALIVRRLSPEDWGGLSLIFGLLGIVGVLGELRVSRVVVVDLVAAGDDVASVMNPFVTLRLVLGLGAYAVSVAIIAVGGFPDRVLLGTVVAGTVLVIASVGTAIDLLLNSRMWLRPIAVASVLGQLLQLLATVALFSANAHTIVLFTIPAVLFEVLALGYRLRVVRGILVLRLAFQVGRWGAWLKDSAPLAVGASLTVIYLQIDLLMVGRLDSLAAAGKYAIGYKFAGLVRFVPDAISAAVLPAMVRAWPADPDGLRKAFRQAATLLIATAGVIAAEFALFSRQAIVLLYGERYSATALATQGLVLGELLAFFSTLCFVVLVAVHRNTAYPLAALLGVLVNVGLNVALIPRWSYNGAALATVVTQVVVLAVMAAAAARIPDLGGLPLRQLATAAAAAGAGVGLGAAVDVWSPWPVSAAVVGIGYLAVLHLLRFNGASGLPALLSRG